MFNANGRNATTSQFQPHSVTESVRASPKLDQTYTTFSSVPLVAIFLLF